MIGISVIISVQTDLLFSNIQETIKLLDNDSLHDDYGSGWPVSSQIFHLLHSMDQWFIDPNEYKEQTILDKQEGKDGYSISELMSYCRTIQVKIQDYIKQLDEINILEKPKKCSFTRLELILGQSRHFMGNPIPQKRMFGVDLPGD
jgi:hypothetical protein